MSRVSVARTVPAAPPFFASGKRSRDLARELGISEAELLARHEGPEVVLLGGAMHDVIEALPGLGEVMVLTRNEAAVHEKTGTFGNITLSGQTGLVLNDSIDLRLFLQHWCTAFALEIPDGAGPRRSLQIFDEAGEAVIKVHLRPGSDVAAFDAIRERFADPRPVLRPVLRRAPETERDVTAIDVDGFRAAFAGMRDVHEFFPLMKRLGLTRRQALDVMEDRYRDRLEADAARRLLERAAASALPIMCFVGNRGCIQIHHGPVTNIKVMGPWLNVLDPGFNLHLREDLVAEAWLVRKPTRHGLITSVELYAADRSLVTQFFGVRDEKNPEDPAWRALATELQSVGA
jgi:putative hemin transport protein